LEAYRRSHPDSGDARFLLAYHYITAGHNDAAAKELKKVVELMPQDKLSAQLLEGITGESPSAPPAEDPAEPTPAPAGATLTGVWRSDRDDGSKIELTLQKDGRFTWSYAHKDKTEKFDGTYTEGNGILTLVPSQGGAMVAALSWKGDKAFNFKITGGPPNDPGLDFHK